MILGKPVFQLWPEVPDKTLNWPSSAVSEPPHHCIHPVNTLSAGGALTT